VPCWRVQKRDGKVFVHEKVEAAVKPRYGKQSTGGKPQRIVIVGGGAAGFAATEMLRREGFAGSLTLLSADEAAPYDRTNCSKDYLAGNAPESSMPLCRQNSMRNTPSTFNSASRSRALMRKRST
jgi:hypothetical protein